MNVRELIATLSELDGDLDVSGEGCDCINPVKGASVQAPVTAGLNIFRHDGYVLLEVDLSGQGLGND